MIVTCCKCFRNTRKFVCPKCGHYVCTSCKEVKRKSRGLSEDQKVRIVKAELRRQHEEVHHIITRYIKEHM